MKKRKLEVADDFGFTVIGICCQLKDYRFSWYLNNKLGISLEKIEDFLFFSAQDKEMGNFSLYQFHKEEENLSFYLINNFSDEQKILIPKQKAMQYFFIVEGSYHHPFIEECVRKIKDVPQVLTAILFDEQQLKAIDLFLYKLEMYIINWRKEQKELLKKKQLYGKFITRQENS